MSNGHFWYENYRYFYYFLESLFLMLYKVFQLLLHRISFSHLFFFVIELLFPSRLCGTLVYRSHQSQCLECVGRVVQRGETINHGDFCREGQC